METTEIQELLQAYVQHGSESAFRDLVKRYLNLVYSTAFRQLRGQGNLAEDIAQTVFTDFARKARTLPPDVLLGGWLHKHACFVASNVLRSERRRLERENQAAQMNTLNDPSDENWKKIAPVLDDAINELAPEDRDAVMLRFFEQRDFRSIGATLGVSDDAAQKRVSRAVDKLRDLLVNHGVTLSAAALVTLLAEQSVASIPSRLAENIAGTALTKAGSSVGAAKFFLSAKMGLALVALITVAAFTPSIVSRILKIVSTESTEANSSDSVSTTATESSREQARIDQSATISTNNSPIDGVKRDLDSTSHLELTILSPDSGRPIPNATINLRGRTDKWVFAKLTTDRYGVCQVELGSDLKTVALTTEIKGFADTRLFWSMDHGEKPPAKYTLRPERAVLIGGTVLDSENNPIEGAKVRFGHEGNLAQNKSPKSHEFGGIEVQSDKEGRWQIDRIASDMLGRLRGGATHTNFLDSNYLRVEADSSVEKELRDRTHVFRLGKGITIHGFVIGPDQNPMQGADVFFGGRDMLHRRETVSGSDGSFSINGCMPDKNTLSAQANGLATSTMEVEGGISSGPYHIQLQPGKTLRVRVQDPQAAPVPHANVWLIQHGNATAGVTVPVQAYFNQPTDEEGRVVWTNAPDSELAFGITASGYVETVATKIRPRDDEHVVTLRKSLVVTGQVRGEDGQAISRFGIICGYPQKQSYNGTTLPLWSRQERFWLSFAGGKYKHAFNEPLIGGSVNPGYVLKFQADGYAPYISRNFSPDEGEVHLDVTLNRANNPSITVLLLDGQSAVRADVGLVLPGLSVSVGSNGLSRQIEQNGGALLTTDEKGQFKLPPDPSISRILITHPEGFADTTLAELAAEPTVYLRPWGALKGRYLFEGKPLVGRKLIIGFGTGGATARAGLTYDVQTCVRTDANGNFVFPKVLAGTHKLVALIPTLSFGIPGTLQSSPLKEVTIRSGETTTVNIGDAGYKVIVHVRFPEGVNRPPGERVMASLHPPAPIPPPELLNDPAALKQWRQSLELKESNPAQRYPLIEDSIGRWTAENVLAGSYEITALALAFEKSADGKPNAPRRGKMNVTVPENPSTGTIDVGVIELK